MYKLSNKRKKNKIVVISTVSGKTKVNGAELNQLRMSGDYRIIPPSEISKKKLVFEITGYTTLSRFFATYITEETFFRIITEFVQVMATLERVNLSTDNLIANPNYIFIDATGQDVRFLYQPLYLPEKQNNVLYFLQYLVNHRIAPTGSNMMRIISFRQFLSSQQYFSTAAFLDYLTPKKQQMINRTPKPRPAPRPVPRPAPRPAPAPRPDRSNDFRPPVNAENFNLLQFDDSATISISDLAEDEIGTSVLGGTNTLGAGNARKAMLVRKKTKESICINKSVFKIGADKAHVDCWVSRNRAVSRVHAILTNYNNRFVLKDNNSTNHTFLNGKRLVPGQEYELKSGDEITIANEVYLFREQ